MRGSPSPGRCQRQAEAGPRVTRQRGDAAGPQPAVVGQEEPLRQRNHDFVEEGCEGLGLGAGEVEAPRPSPWLGTLALGRLRLPGGWQGSQQGLPRLRYGVRRCPSLLAFLQQFAQLGHRDGLQSRGMGHAHLALGRQDAPPIQNLYPSSPRRTEAPRGSRPFPCGPRPAGTIAPRRSRGRPMDGRRRSAVECGRHAAPRRRAPRRRARRALSVPRDRTPPVGWVDHPLFARVA